MEPLRSVAVCKTHRRNAIHFWQPLRRRLEHARVQALFVTGHFDQDFVTYTFDMTATLSLLLDDGGAHLVASAVQADDLLSLFSAHGVACHRSVAGDSAKLQLVKAEQILQAHTLLQEWLKRKGLHDTLHDESPAMDTQHS